MKAGQAAARSTQLTTKPKSEKTKQTKLGSMAGSDGEGELMTELHNLQFSTTSKTIKIEVDSRRR